MYYFDTVNSKKIIKSTLLSDDFIQAFFTTKESFIRTSDEKFANIVEQNKKDIAKYLNTDILISPVQTHGDNIEIVSDKKDYPDCDSLILTRKDFAIFLNYADCTPVILYDKKQHSGAVVHAGWRGTAASIVKKTLHKMNSEPKDITALIGPCICFKCFETSKEAYFALKDTVKNTQGIFREENGSYFADLKGINKRQLEESGIKNIDVCPYCTVCNNEFLFSYRKENKTANRISAVLKL